MFEIINREKAVTGCIITAPLQWLLVPLHHEPHSGPKSTLATWLPGTCLINNWFHVQRSLISEGHIPSSGLGTALVQLRSNYASWFEFLTSSFSMCVSLSLDSVLWILKQLLRVKSRFLNLCVTSRLRNNWEWLRGKWLNCWNWRLDHSCCCFLYLRSQWGYPCDWSGLHSPLPQRSEVKHMGGRG